MSLIEPYIQHLAALSRRILQRGGCGFPSQRRLRGEEGRSFLRLDERAIGRSAGGQVSAAVPTVDCQYEHNILLWPL